jgi:RimJ/RimL family protein N-acetyltransferase
MPNRLDKLPEINTLRLVLREIRDYDVQSVYEIYSHPDVIRYWDHPVWTDKSQAADLIQSAQKGFSEYKYFAWCTTLRDSGNVIGTCSLFDYLQEHRTAEIGYAFHPDHWGQGYASEIIPELVAFGFDYLDLNRIHAEADPRNVGSTKALLRMGFQQEGRLRENWVYPGEKPSDTILLGLLRNEWIPSKTNNRMQSD